MSLIHQIINAIDQALIQDQRYITYLKGIKVTLMISLIAVLIGVTIGVIVAVVKVGYHNTVKPKWYLRRINGICNLYIGVIRGTPVFLQLLIIYNMVFTSRGTNEVLAAALAFGINSGAYVAEIVRAGIMSVDRGQMEAGRSLGLNQLQTMRYIILPQAVKNILPALGNEFVTLIKETSVASVIAVTDTTQAARTIGLRTYDIMTPLFIAAGVYLILVLGLTKLMNIVERRLAKSDTY
ncbi:amino acid transport system permease protein [Lachnospiraceae bacterium KM106-2]|nr:amino acid transport system permease protein [Lachnospiraceae bacterium KM106-2]